MHEGDDSVIFGFGSADLGSQHRVMNRVNVGGEGVIGFVVVPYQKIARCSVDLSSQVAFIGSRPSSKPREKLCSNCRFLRGDYRSQHTWNR